MIYVWAAACIKGKGNIMDFSRRGIIQKQKSLRSNGKRLNSKLWITVFRILIILLVTVAIAVVMGGLGAFNALIDTAPEVPLENLDPSALASYSYYSDGTLAQEFVEAEGNRKVVTIDQIPLGVQHAFVALEDERFYEHSGIDLRGILRAGVSVVSSGGRSFGGSTITQQLLKNVIFEGGNEPSILDKVQRKIQEQFLAIQLENVLSKDEILYYYLNNVNMGNRSYGIQKAAENYFGKNVEDLTISEAAAIAPTVLSPTNRNPLTHPEANSERREACLNKMLELGYCSQEEYDEAMADPVYDRIAAFNATRTYASLSTFSYFTDAMFEQVKADLMAKYGYTDSEAEHLIFTGGLTIYTTQDREAQQIVDSYYTNESNFPAFGFESTGGSCYYLDKYALSVYKADGSVIHYQKNDFLNYFKDYVDTEKLYYHEKGGNRGISEYFISRDDMDAKIEEYKAARVEEGDTPVESKVITVQPQSSFVLYDQKTGAVVAIYGGRGVKEQSRSQNRATASKFQVGSTFKVLASFMPAIDGAGKTLATVYDDSPFFYPRNYTTDPVKEVVNWYSTGFRGLQSIRKGIASSLNVIAVKCICDITPELSYSYLKKLGFSSLVDSSTRDGRGFSDINPSLALGGLTDGVTNLELTAGYATIANAGVYHEPIFYTKVLDHAGNILLERESKSTQVIKTSTAWLLTSAMESVITEGTGSNLDITNKEGYPMHVAGKTGTASKNTALWFVGFTPYYTAGIWTGFDYGFDQINHSYQQHLWRRIMAEIHRTKQLPDAEFEKPDSIVTADICTKCGKLAVKGLCDKAEGGSCIKTEYFAKGTVPTQVCDCHVKVDICTKSKKLATDYCDEKYHKTVILCKKDEHYENYLTEEEMEVLAKKLEKSDTRDMYTFPIVTWDTPYVYDPVNVCTKHLPSTMTVDENGNVVSKYLLEYEKQLIENLEGSDASDIEAEDTEEDDSDIEDNGVLIGEDVRGIKEYDTTGESDTY